MKDQLCIYALMPYYYEEMLLYVTMLEDIRRLIDIHYIGIVFLRSYTL